MRLVVLGAALGTSAAAMPPDRSAASADRTFTGEGELTWFGARALAIGDCDGDTIEDLLIAARFDSTEGLYHNGRCTVYSGATSEPLLVFHGEGNDDELGHRLDRIGDLDGDGRADVLLGAYQHDNNTGRCYAFSGRTGEVLHVWTGTQEESLFGWDLSNAGDTNGDGVNDVIISSQTYDGAGVDSGAAYLYDGRSGALIHEWFGEVAGDRFGFRAAPLGDVDGDSRPDVAIAAPGNGEAGPGAGKVYLYSGRTGELIRSYVGENADDALGERVAGEFDVDGDGRTDVLIGSLHYSPAKPNAGRVYLYSGLDGSLIRTFDGERAGDQLGHRVKFLEDLNGDQVPEIAMSATYADANGIGSGSVFIHSGASRELLYRYDGDLANDRLGRVVQGVGDLNHDGFNDFAIGSPFVTTGEGGSEIGRAYVFSGRTGKQLLRLTGETAGDQFGYSINRAGDMNGDGFADFTVGAVYNDAGGPDAGRAYVFFGSPIFLTHSNFVAGSGAAITVTGAEQDEFVHLLMSLQGVGEGPQVSQLGGLQLRLLPPVSEQAARWTDADGNAEFELQVPPGAAGRILHFQAVIRRGPRGGASVMSNTISPQVEP